MYSFVCVLQFTAIVALRYHDEKHHDRQVHTGSMLQQYTFELRDSLRVMRKLAALATVSRVSPTLSCMGCVRHLDVYGCGVLPLSTCLLKQRTSIMMSFDTTDKFTLAVTCSSILGSCKQFHQCGVQIGCSGNCF